MKFTLAQLRKFNMPYSYSEDLDLSKDLNGFEDIKSSSLCHVDYIIKERGDETYLVEFKYQIDLVLEDSVSLEEIPYQIKDESSELYTTDKENSDATIIEGITLDTYEAVLTEVLSSKPMSITNHQFEDDSADYEEEEEDKINPAFANLKDLLK